MAEVNTQTDPKNWGENPDKLPDMLNVLTILTFIGCGIGLIFSILGFINAQASYDRMVGMQDKLDQLPGIAKKFMGSDPVGSSLRLLENKTPIFLLALVGYGLCLYGALQMRKRKKIGFSIYLLGELVVPIISGVIFIGASSMAGFAAIFGLVIVAVFIILYATQLKYLR